MAAIIELELLTEEFALEKTLTTLPKVDIEIERLEVPITPVWNPEIGDV